MSTATVMTFPTAGNDTVSVTSIDGGSTPYRWSCSAAHRSERSFASLPFARRDAEAHAAGCLSRAAINEIVGDFGVEAYSLASRPGGVR